jgi:hypothetical protein
MDCATNSVFSPLKGDVLRGLKRRNGARATVIDRGFGAELCGRMRSKRNRAGNAKSCGADFYHMPELERLPNPLQEQERCQQGSQILGTPSSGRPLGVRRVSCVGLACGPCFSISRSHGGRSSNVGCRWPTGAGSTASCVRDDPVISVTLASEDGSPIA